LASSIRLRQILNLVGKLDDSPGDDTPRERFRRFLRENVKDIGQLRDYIEECLRNPGEQYNRALQDLVNHIGNFLGFEVTFGRYKGIKGKIGFDGHWKSPLNFHIVIEVKTTEIYAIKTSTLIGYIDELISERQIPDWENALGLYVIGRLEPEIRQLENAILAERRLSQLRIISVDSLISLAEMMGEYEVNHDDILFVLRPSGPNIDPIVDLISRLIAQSRIEEPEEKIEEVAPKEEIVEEVTYWLTPTKSDEVQTAEEAIDTLVRVEGIYAFGERTPGRKYIKPGDWICFYASGRGIVGYAQVDSKPIKKPHPRVRHPEKYPWVFRVKNVKLFLDKPIILDSSRRSKLDAFKGRDPGKPWGWFVQSTRKISKHDFKLLTSQSLN